jgi:hypothetical protein
MSGFVAAWRFLQGAAASEWRASLELIKLYGTTRGREAARVDELDTIDPDADVTPEDVAAVVRILRAHDVGGLDGEADGQAVGVPNSPAEASAVRSNGAGQVIE